MQYSLSSFIHDSWVFKIQSAKRRDVHVFGNKKDACNIVYDACNTDCFLYKNKTSETLLLTRFNCDQGCN